jgi:hypothetical protein
MGKEGQSMSDSYQWESIPPQGRAVKSAQMRHLGEQAPKLAEIAHEKAKASTAKKSDKEAATWGAVRPQLQSHPMTLTGAARARVRQVYAGMDRAEIMHGGDLSHAGAGWYFAHRGRIDEHGGATDHSDTYRNVTASARLSPQNDPVSEVKSLGEMMKQRAGQPHSEKDLRGGGTDFNRARANTVLETGEDDINPLKEPKLYGYRNAIHHAEPNTPVEQEFMGRMAYVNDVRQRRISRGQGRLDLWGLNESREGILDPQGDTAEDTWMNAISTEQPNELAPGTKSNVAKTLGSAGFMYPPGKTHGPKMTSMDPRGEVSAAAIHHAWNNKATRMAAEEIGQEAGLVDSQGESLVPAVGVQEMSWTEFRRVGGKDSPYAQEVSAMVDPKPTAMDKENAKIGRKRAKEIWGKARPSFEQEGLF